MVSSLRPLWSPESDRIFGSVKGFFKALQGITILYHPSSLGARLTGSLFRNFSTTLGIVGSGSTLGRFEQRQQNVAGQKLRGHLQQIQPQLSTAGFTNGVSLFCTYWLLKFPNGLVFGNYPTNHGFSNKHVVLSNHKMGIDLKGVENF